MTVAVLLIGAACLLAFWPAAWTPTLSHPMSTNLLRRPPSFAAAIASLSMVQERLGRTGELNEQQRKAIDTLTLALVKGSVDEA